MIVWDLEDRWFMAVAAKRFLFSNTQHVEHIVHHVNGALCSRNVSPIRNSKPNPFPLGGSGTHCHIFDVHEPCRITKSVAAEGSLARSVRCRAHNNSCMLWDIDGSCAVYVGRPKHGASFQSLSDHRQ